MGALVYDCDEEIAATVESLKQNGASDSEIMNALRRAAEDIFERTYDDPYS